VVALPHLVLQVTVLDDLLREVLQDKLEEAREECEPALLPKRLTEAGRELRLKGSTPNCQSPDSRALEI
jgi:hypothetical protein